MLEFELSGKDLLTSISASVSMIEKKQLMPIYGYTLVDISENGSIKIVSSDAEREIVSFFSSQQSFDRDVSFLVSGKMFFDVIKSLNEDIIHFKIVDNTLYVSSKTGYSEFRLLIRDTNDFMLIDLSEQDLLEEIHLSAKEFQENLQMVSFAMGADNTRDLLKGLLVKFNEGFLTFVATDGHRLTLSSIELDKSKEFGNLSEFILPRKTVLELLKLLTNIDEDVKICFYNSSVQFSIGNNKLTTKLIAGQFPDYKNVIKYPEDISIYLNRLVFKEALQRVGVLLCQKNKKVVLSFSNETLQLNVSNIEGSELATDIIKIDYEGNPFEISFYAPYLFDFLNNVDSEEVFLNFYPEDLTKGCLFKSVGNLYFLYVVMPVR